MTDALITRAQEMIVASDSLQTLEGLLQHLLDMRRLNTETEVMHVRMTRLAQRATLYKSVLTLCGLVTPPDTPPAEGEGSTQLHPLFSAISTPPVHLFSSSS
ncbi:hypothetical protein PMAYCL1PPCAC_27112, partial [Pristionchus mayeri]